ncbi:hypothetical protein A2U01_0117318, partial [Trifolium medium]|nr:hypothetical protein [Trifolium medium]
MPSLSERVASARHCSPADRKLTVCGHWRLAERPWQGMAHFL